MLGSHTLSPLRAPVALPWDRGLLSGSILSWLRSPIAPCLHAALPIRCRPLHCLSRRLRGARGGLHVCAARVHLRGVCAALDEAGYEPLEASRPLPGDSGADTDGIGLHAGVRSALEVATTTTQGLEKWLRALRRRKERQGRPCSERDPHPKSLPRIPELFRLMWGGGGCLGMLGNRYLGSPNFSRSCGEVRVHRAGCPGAPRGGGARGAARRRGGFGGAVGV